MLFLNYVFISALGYLFVFLVFIYYYHFMFQVKLFNVLDFYHVVIYT